MKMNDRRVSLLYLHLSLDGPRRARRGPTARICAGCRKMIVLREMQLQKFSNSFQLSKKLSSIPIILFATYEKKLN